MRECAEPLALARGPGSTVPDGRRALSSYRPEPIAIHLPDGRAPLIAALISAQLRAVVPTLAPEHIGSTSVAGLPGEGIVDLASRVDADRLRSVVHALLGAGWTLRPSIAPAAPTRPVLAASLDHEGQPFRVHLHLVPTRSDELSELIAFRDALRADHLLRARYAERKRAVVASGGSEDDYARAKADVIVPVLRARGHRPSGVFEKVERPAPARRASR
jgi:GrpB-like predicted nucleotidyltransferase (UPF0157 family)